MKIVVCVKQVPEITEVRVNPETGTLVREGVAAILNPFCEYALDHAARLKALGHDVDVIALTMGPFQARAACALLQIQTQLPGLHLGLLALALLCHEFLVDQMPKLIAHCSVLPAR